MSTRNLNHLFEPRSVAIIGASNDPSSAGAVVMRNMLTCGFSGAIHPVNPKHETVQGMHAWASVRELSGAPDLAVIATPPAAVPQIVADLGAIGTKAAIVLSAGITDVRRFWGRSLRERMLEAARPHLMRVLGPDSVGLLVPGLRLNASAAHACATPGRMAFLSHSGALGQAVLDWARSRGIGFSKFVFLGEAADVDFGDLLDYLASDPETSAILLYLESIRSARKFMSAARAAARNKPVVVVKAGRAPEAARAAALHTRVLVSSDDVIDAALRRAGMLRVSSTEDLFDAVETLARARRLDGENLAVMANGGGPGVMAVDALVALGGRPAELAVETRERLRALIPPYGRAGNPVDVLGYAPAARHAEVLVALLEDPDAGAVLVVHAPNALVPAEDVAKAIAPVATSSARNVLACWLGGDSVSRARQVSAEAGVPTYDTPEKAVRAFMHIVDHRRNQALLGEVPGSIPEAFEPASTLARAIIRAALGKGRTLLSEPEAKSVLAAYGIPVVETHIAHSGRTAERIAMTLGFPLAVKIVSDDVPHKSEIGGVALQLESIEQVRGAIASLRKRLRALRPQAKLRGFAVQRMANRPGATELIVGAATDPVFGPVLLFGRGGTEVELTADRAVALPPLNMVLARDMVSRTRVARLLSGYGGRPKADLEAIYLTLIKVSQMIADLPEIVELDINPLLADDNGVIALDATMRVAPAKSQGVDRLAIRPYPKELEEWIDWDRRRVLLRPIRPEDAGQHLRFFEVLDPEDVRMRVFTPLRELPQSQLARLTQIDYDREMAFIATADAPSGEAETLGVVRAVTDPDNVQAEFAIIVRSDLKGRGLGSILMRKIVTYCRERGTARIVGETFFDNTRLQRLARGLGFSTRPSEEPGVVVVEIDLLPGGGRAAATSASTR